MVGSVHVVNGVVWGPAQKSWEDAAKLAIENAAKSVEDFALAMQ